AVASMFPKEQKLFAYLTPDGDPASDETWSAISYSDVVSALEEAQFRHASSLTEETKVVIEHYVGLIRRNIVPDQELIEQCRKLYAKHKDALELVMRYGEVNAFDSAAEQFFVHHSELNRFATGSGSVAVFLPNLLIQVIPTIEGTVWWGQSRPLLFWFNFVQP